MGVKRSDRRLKRNVRSWKVAKIYMKMADGIYPLVFYPVGLKKAFKIVGLGVDA